MSNPPRGPSRRWDDKRFAAERDPTVYRLEGVTPPPHEMDDIVFTKGVHPEVTSPKEVTVPKPYHGEDRRKSDQERSVEERKQQQGQDRRTKRIEPYEGEDRRKAKK